MGQFQFLKNIPNGFSEKKIQYILNRTTEFRKDINDSLKLIRDKFIVLEDGRTIKEGQIIYRPLSYKKNISSNGFNHYAIVLGTTKDNKRLIVDINNDRNVAVDDFNNFKLHFQLSLVEIEYNNTAMSLILERIKEVQFAYYYFDAFNCRHFVNYCVYGKKESEAVDVLVNFISPLLDVYIIYLDFKITIFKENRDKEIYTQYRDFIFNINDGIKKLKT